MIGDKDIVVNNEEAAILLEQTSSEDKQLIAYPDWGHVSMFMPVANAKFKEDALNWIKKRL